jgi:hypothetical protein
MSVLRIVTFSVAVLSRKNDLAELLADGVRELGRIHVGPLELLLEPPDVGENRADEEQGLAHPDMRGGLADDLHVLRLKVNVSRKPVDSSPRAGV